MRSPLITLLGLGSVLARHAVHSSADRRSSLIAARTPPPPPPIATSPLDVVRTTAGSFATIGGLGFCFTAFQEATARAAVSGDARKAVPYFVLKAALQNGQRWGRVSAGFAGGRAAGQLLRGGDDAWSRLMGSVVGGAAAATSLASVPSSCATFAAFGYFFDSFTHPPGKKGGGARAGGAPRPQKPKLSPGQQLDRLLGTSPEGAARAVQY